MSADKTNRNKRLNNVLSFAAPQPRSVKSFAQRKLGAVLDADRYALINTNRRARAGLKPKSISRFEN